MSESSGLTHSCREYRLSVKQKLFSHSFTWYNGAYLCLPSTERGHRWYLKVSTMITKEESMTTYSDAHLPAWLTSFV